MQRTGFLLALISVGALGYYLGAPRPAQGTPPLSVPSAISAERQARVERLVPSDPLPPQAATGGRRDSVAVGALLPYPQKGPFDTPEKLVGRFQELAIEHAPSRWQQSLYNGVNIGSLESAHYVLASRAEVTPAGLEQLDRMIQTLRGLEQEMRAGIRAEVQRTISQRDWDLAPGNGARVALGSSDSLLSSQIPLLEGGHAVVHCRRAKVPQVMQQIERSSEVYNQAVAHARALGWDFSAQIAAAQPTSGARRSPRQDR